MQKPSIKDIIAQEQRTGTPFWKIMVLDDAAEQNVPPEEVIAKMEEVWQAMLDADAAYEPDRRSFSGLVGGDGAKMAAYRQKGDTLCGDYSAGVIALALSMGESNACMKRIVAAPTAGACGVLPAVLIPLEKSGTPREKIIEGLFVAGGVGAVIAHRASIAGASGGCQAEIGAASAMAAAALVHIKGGTSAQMSDAAAMALANLLGLVCDPVAGLVEIPCIKRNVIGALNAMASADMALAGITNVIPADEVIDAMGEIGSALPFALRETALGGLATTSTAQSIQESFHNKSQCDCGCACSGQVG